MGSRGLSTIQRCLLFLSLNFLILLLYSTSLINNFMRIIRIDIIRVDICGNFFKDDIWGIRQYNTYVFSLFYFLRWVGPCCNLFSLSHLLFFIFFCYECGYLFQSWGFLLITIPCDLQYFFFVVIICIYWKWLSLICLFFY